MTDQNHTPDGMPGAFRQRALGLPAAAAIAAHDFDAAYRRAARVFELVEPPTIERVDDDVVDAGVVIEPGDVRVGQTHRVVWENARVCKVTEDDDGAVAIEYDDGNLVAVFGQGTAEADLYLIDDVEPEPEPIDDDALLEVMARAFWADRRAPFDYDSLTVAEREHVRASMRAALAALEQHRNVEPKPRRA